MTRRMRFVSGLCALLALTFSFAESVWASTCGMPMASGMAEAHESVPDVPSGEHCAAHQARDTEPDGPADRPCPFDSGFAPQACAGVVSLPATTAVLPALGPETAGGIFTLEVRPEILFGASLFRPPRA